MEKQRYYQSRHRSRSRHHHRHRNNSENELRKKQDRLARARLLLMQEEEENNNTTQNIMDLDHAPNNIGLKDELEEAVEAEIVEIEHYSKQSDLEIDPLDSYMQQIECQAVQQIGAKFVKQETQPQLVSMEEIQQMEVDQSLDDDNYYQAFIQAFKQKQEPQQIENIQKPEVLYEEDDDKIWDMLLEDDENNKFIMQVNFTQQKLAQSHKKLPEFEISTEPFRKNLYIQCPELSRLDYEEIIALRDELGSIKVRGKRCPAPILNWYQCGLSDKILKVLDKKQFKGPFPVQAQAIPAIMSGRDAIGIAETGSGKTLAYLLPMLRHILDQRPLQNQEGPIGLIMAPTRELAFQIYLESRVSYNQAFCKVLGLRCVCVYGGTGVTQQLSDLKKGAEIVVCTPGRMIDVLCLNNGGITNLKRVTYLVLDEADRMFDMGFEPQINKIIGGTRPDRQTVMFSATFPKYVENLAKRILHKPVEIVVGGRNTTATSVEQFIEVIDEDDKLYRLLEILEDWYSKGNILIFVERQQECDALFKDLVNEGYELLALHGGHDQQDRDFTIMDYKKGVKTLMVATSIAARGLDVRSLVLVINYRCPNHMEDYIHRIGRTGRAGNKGTAITFITKEESKYAWELIKVLQHSGQEVSEDLQDLALEFKQMVEDGEAKPYKSRGFGGKGYKFTSEEFERARDKKKKRKRDFVFSDSDTDSAGGDDFKPNKKKSEMSLADLIKDPKVRSAAMSAAQTAAKAAIMSGNPNNAMNAAKEAVELVVRQIQQEPDVEDQMENVLKVKDEWVNKTNSGKAVMELDINDYPLTARARIMSRDYLNTINDLTHCNVLVRGSYIDSGRKSVIGQKRLHLVIEGPTKIHCNNARNEIRRYLEELNPTFNINL